MDKKQADRRPAEKPAEHGSGRRMPEAPEGNKGFGKPEGQPIDKPLPSPEAHRKEDLLESERSDRESGRPVQLDEEDEDDERESIRQRLAAEEQKRGRKQTKH